MKKIEKDKVYIDGNYIVIASVLVLILFLLIFSFGTVKTGYFGIKTRFGKVTDSELHEGINFKFPFIESIYKINLKVQKVEMDIESSTKDLQIVNTTVAVNYRLDVEKVTELFKEVGSSYEETILSPAIKESIKSAIAKYNAEEITVNRSEVSNNCLNAIQEKVSKYGIIIEDFNLTDFSFSEEYTKSIEDKQVAEQKLEKAKLEAERKVIEAEATKKANELLHETLTEELIEKQFIDKWDGKLPDTFVGNESLFSIIGK